MNVIKQFITAVLKYRTPLLPHSGQTFVRYLEERETLSRGL